MDSAGSCVWEADLLNDGRVEPVDCLASFDSLLGASPRRLPLRPEVRLCTSSAAWSGSPTEVEFELQLKVQAPSGPGTLLRIGCIGKGRC